MSHVTWTHTYGGHIDHVCVRVPSLSLFVFTCLFFVVQALLVLQLATVWVVLKSLWLLKKKKEEEKVTDHLIMKQNSHLSFSIQMFISLFIFLVMATQIKSKQVLLY